MYIYMCVCVNVKENINQKTRYVSKICLKVCTHYGHPNIYVIVSISKNSECATFPILLHALKLQQQQQQ